MYGSNHKTNMSSVFAHALSKLRCKLFGPRSGPSKTRGPNLDAICLAFFEKVRNQQTSKLFGMTEKKFDLDIEH